MGIADPLTFRAATFRRCLLIAAIAAPAAVTAPARAGDEVDYSAPYVTVENGELVTRYPAKEHDEPEVGKQTAAPSRDGGRLPLVASVVVVAAFGITVVVVALRRAFARRASRPRSPDAL